MASEPEAGNSDPRLAALQRRIDDLERVCAEAYQFAGTVGAPERVLDNLSARRGSADSSRIDLARHRRGMRRDQ